MRRVIFAVVAGAVLAGTTLAGAATSSAVVVDRGSTMRIAVAAPLSGPLAPFGTIIRNGVELAVADHPRVKGLPVELVAVDAPCSLPQDVEAAAAIVDDETIVGVVGPACSGSADVTLPLFEAAGVVTVSPTATEPGLGTYAPTTFNRTAVDDSGFDAWYAAVGALPSDVAFWETYEALYGPPPARVFGDLAYDATLVLLTALKQVATLEQGSVVVDRGELAAAVRATAGLHGVTCTITLEADGDRLDDEEALARCAADDAD